MRVWRVGVSVGASAGRTSVAEKDFQRGRATRSVNEAGKPSGDARARPNPRVRSFGADARNQPGPASFAARARAIGDANVDDVTPTSQLIWRSGRSSEE